MKTNFTVGCISLFILLQACDSNHAELPQADETREVVFTSIIDDRVLTRAANSSWDAGDQIGIYMLKSDGQTIVSSNVPYITHQGDGYFVGNGGTLSYPEDGTNVDFFAYYPYQEGTDYTAYSLDMSDQSNSKAIDLMVANNLTNRNNTSVTGNLQFQHLLAKVVLNLKTTDGSSLTGISATLSGVKAKATANLSKIAEESYLTSADETTDISMAVNSEGTQAEAILIPQTLSEALKITLKIGNKSKEVETSIQSLAAGTRYSVNVTIQNTGNDIVVDPEATSYAKWFETPVITESQQANTDLVYINHYFKNNFKDAAGNALRNYSMLYSKTLKFAYWVAYPLFTNCTGDSGRTDAWGYDPEITTSWQADLSSGFSGYDRGHQLPSGDRTCDKTTNATTFYYTNMTPQRSNMNQKIWAPIEEKVRGWRSGTDTVYVVTGAIPPTQNVSYTSGVAIPEYYFKALARRISATNSYQTIALTAANDNNATIKYLSVTALEELTGFTFFPNIDSQYKTTTNTL